MRNGLVPASMIGNTEMSTPTYLKIFDAYVNIKAIVLSILMAVMPTFSVADIIWSGDFGSGNFKQYHMLSDPDTIAFFQIPEYGRPIQYGGQHQLHVGNGELLSLVAASPRTANGVFYAAGPTRGGEYAAKFTIKNSGEGIETLDCDVNADCKHRRTQLTMQGVVQPDYNGLPLMGERWIAVSIYLPADFENSGSGFGPQMWEIKPRQDGGSGDVIGLVIHQTGSWSISHNWQLGEPKGFAPVHQQMRYRADYPAPGSDWPDGDRDFAEPGSQAALGNITLGDWTDWVFHIRFDSRGSDRGGTGFLNVWKRDGSSPWKQILALIPRQTTRMGVTFNRGVGVGAAGGFGPKLGPYMHKTRVWNNSKNMVVYIGNHKIGDELTTFQDMSPDGSSPNATPTPLASKPMPPVMQLAE